MRYLAAWFVAAVWPNLVASAIWGLPAGMGFVWHHRRIKQHISCEIRSLHTQQVAHDRSENT
jgi:hypothetical protein